MMTPNWPIRAGGEDKPNHKPNPDWFKRGTAIDGDTVYYDCVCNTLKNPVFVSDSESADVFRLGDLPEACDPSNLLAR